MNILYNRGNENDSLFYILRRQNVFKMKILYIEVEINTKIWYNILYPLNKPITLFYLKYIPWSDSNESFKIFFSAAFLDNACLYFYVLRL